MAQITLNHITKEFDKGVKIIDDLNLNINDGEFLVLVGPSGCGKSTTLRMIAGLESVTAGDIFIGDRRVNDVPPKDRDIAMVFQNYALYPHMTVYENLSFGLKLRKMPKAEIKQRVIETAAILEIEELLNRKPRQLSGGQRQRVALGRAIVRKPKVFLFDEPLSNLDAKLRLQMRTEIKRLHQRLKTTMVYVTHDQVEAMTMGDRIVVMKSGLIHQIDTPVNLYNSPVDMFVAGFIGSPPMNFISVTLRQEDFLIADEGNVRLKIPAEHTEKLRAYIGKNLVIGIRPENILMQPSDSNHVKIRVKLDICEPMGNETYLYLTTGKTNLVARSNTVPSEKPGSDITVFLNLQDDHYFNPQTEKVI
ncbi:MAG: glycerol-3-phosphate ABC transporter ATP-binding protein [Candidatus Marinimicrobia bacterium CG08_land_8_20_14_0_20_45_22]|nr:MAG: glycerol-3-phosphate ABC transporter ATP-binding protein [Candidatus Marinimicrobia bacterium CG08_land_8_20_14_0_20_45_22]